jgi:hypothetical protein
MNSYAVISKKNITKAVLMASLAVAFATPAANAQYMVIDGVSASPNAFAEPVCCQTIYVQDYSNFSGINDLAKGNDLTSTAIINGLFDGYTGVFGACIGIPAIMIAVLRLFVSKQQQPKRTRRNSFELPAAPASSSYFKPSPVRF